MPKSKRHYPRLKRKTHRKYRGGGYHGGAPPAIAEKMTNPRKCASSGFFGFGSPAPYGCSSAEAVVKSLTAFYNEGLNTKDDKTNEYNESKTWLTTQLQNYLSGRGVFVGNGQSPQYGLQLQPQQPSLAVGPSLSNPGYSGSSGLPTYSGPTYSGPAAYPGQPPHNPRLGLTGNSQYMSGYPEGLLGLNTSY